MCYQKALMSYQNREVEILNDLNDRKTALTFVADYITADDIAVMLNHNGSTTSSLFMAIIT